MKANGWILDENKGANIGWKQMGGFWKKIKGWIVDESKWVAFGWK
jgi:hypothetical protein